MAKSLQDQLLNVGLATEEQLKKAQETKKKAKRKAPAKRKPQANKVNKKKSQFPT